MELVKYLFKDTKTLVVTIFILSFFIAILGYFPTGSDSADWINLEWWQRLLFGLLGIGSIIGYELYLSQKLSIKPPHNEDYLRRFKNAQDEIEHVKVPKDHIVDEKDFRGTRVAVYLHRIEDAKTDVLVSSDDNHLQALGGVAKVLLDRAGAETRSGLYKYSKFKLKQGQVAITTAGSMKALAIFHPVVINIDLNIYPDVSLIRKIVNRCLVLAESIGAESIAFPVLGGGTGKNEGLSPWDSIQTIIGEVIEYIKCYKQDENHLQYIALYIFNPIDIKEEINLAKYKSEFI